MGSGLWLQRKREEEERTECEQRSEEGSQVFLGGQRQEGTKAKGVFEHRLVKEIIWKAFFPGTHGDHHLSTRPRMESTMFRKVSLSDL